MLKRRRSGTGLSDLYWPVWPCQRMLPWTLSLKDLRACSPAGRLAGSFGFLGPPAAACPLDKYLELWTRCL